MINATATIGISWEPETGIVEDNGGNACQLSDLVDDVEDGSLREMIESWTCEPLAGEALKDYEALCDAIRGAKAVDTTKKATNEAIREQEYQEAYKALTAEITQAMALRQRLAGKLRKKTMGTTTTTTEAAANELWEKAKKAAIAANMALVFEPCSGGRYKVASIIGGILYQTRPQTLEDCLEYIQDEGEGWMHG